MRVVLVGFLKILSSGLKPTYLIRFNPIIALEVSLVWRIAMGIEEIEGECRVLIVAMSKHFDVVVAYTFDSVGACLGE